MPKNIPLQVRSKYIQAWANEYKLNLAAIKISRKWLLNFGVIVTLLTKEIVHTKSRHISSKKVSTYTKVNQLFFYVKK